MHLDAITQQNAAMVEELSAATNSVRDQVKAVSQTLRLFRLQPTDETVAEADAVELRRAIKATQDCDS
ncbi:MAG TPA: hypothetical protein VMU33_11680 [Burkholderiaceae bacterium]|nr:hypothetical protein [Burkholderiaceae bacterium]